MQHANYTLVTILRCLAKKKLYWYWEKYGNWTWKRQFLRGLGVCHKATKSILRIYQDNSFKVLLWSKIDFYFFFRCIITPSFKSLCPREVRSIEPRFLTSTGHDYKIYIWPWTTEKVGTEEGSDVIQSRQDNVATLVAKLKLTLK